MPIKHINWGVRFLWWSLPDPLTKMSNHTLLTAKAAGGVGDIVLCFLCHWNLATPAEISWGCRSGGGAVPFTAALKNSKKFLCLASICNWWRDTNLVFHYSCWNTVIHSWALCTSQKKEMDISNRHMEPKETEKFIRTTVMIISKDKEAKCMYEKKYLGKKCISKSLIPY